MTDGPLARDALRQTTTGICTRSSSSGPLTAGPALTPAAWLRAPTRAQQPHHTRRRGNGRVLPSAQLPRRGAEPARRRHRTRSTRQASSATHSCTRAAPPTGIPTSSCSASWATARKRQGGLATSWHAKRILNPARDGSVLSILHLNEDKIANPTMLARSSEDDLIRLVRGCGYEPIVVAAAIRAPCTRRSRAALDHCLDDTDTMSVSNASCPNRSEVIRRALSRADVEFRPTSRSLRSRPRPPSMYAKCMQTRNNETSKVVRDAQSNRQLPSPAALRPIRRDRLDRREVIGGKVAQCCMRNPPRRWSHATGTRRPNAVGSTRWQPVSHRSVTLSIPTHCDGREPTGDGVDFYRTSTGPGRTDHHARTQVRMAST